ncbi:MULTISPECIES: GNAT family N-acetyltransferase [Actinomycetes]|uniref:GNAT family N-acetyltransferase n=1 Tax=Parenemella sanctibonifatiensis TaxID=2016505 RepID=A0A255DY75_9ACTN|nr:MULTISPECIES: GNAT family N-acetyltransferase [Actinomycetes]OYN84040.1 GNAT family N-acetyltransferase [Parenemella sanctibonifatiensis]
MTNIVYRPYQPQDAEDIKKIINEAFYIHRYVTGRLVLDSALEIYLRERLLASTWTRVAVQDGRVVGVIMGQVDGQPRLGGRFTNRLLTLAHMLRAGILGLPQWKSMRQYFAFDRVYGELRKKTPSPLTDELTLFAVDSSTRGLGIGKTLYRDYLDHLRSLGRSDFYLYTDSLCTFQFYEKQGMTRTASEDMNLVLDGKPEALGVYLYSGTAT